MSINRTDNKKTSAAAADDMKVSLIS